MRPLRPTNTKKMVSAVEANRDFQDGGTNELLLVLATTYQSSLIDGLLQARVRDLGWFHSCACVPIRQAPLRRGPRLAQIPITQSAHIRGASGNTLAHQNATRTEGNPHVDDRRCGLLVGVCMLDVRPPKDHAASEAVSSRHMPDGTEWTTNNLQVTMAGSSLCRHPTQLPSMGSLGEQARFVSANRSRGGVKGLSFAVPDADCNRR